MERIEMNNYSMKENSRKRKQKIKIGETNKKWKKDKSGKKNIRIMIRGEESRKQEMAQRKKNEGEKRS